MGCDEGRDVDVGCDGDNSVAGCIENLEVGCWLGSDLDVERITGFVCGDDVGRIVGFEVLPS